MTENVLAAMIAAAHANQASRKFQPREGLNFHDRGILAFIDHRERIGHPLSLKDLAFELGISKPTAIRLVKRMEVAGLVRKDCAPDDRRRMVIRPLARSEPAGRPLLAMAGGLEFGTPSQLGQQRLPLGIAMIEAVSTRVVHGNSALAEILECWLDPEADVRLLDWIHLDDQPAASANLARLNAGEISLFQMESLRLRDDGGSFKTRLTVVRLRVISKELLLHLAIIEALGATPHRRSFYAEDDGA